MPNAHESRQSTDDQCAATANIDRTGVALAASRIERATAFGQAETQYRRLQHTERAAGDRQILKRGQTLDRHRAARTYRRRAAEIGDQDIVGRGGQDITGPVRGVGPIERPGSAVPRHGSRSDHQHHVVARAADVTDLERVDAHRERRAFGSSRKRAAHGIRAVVVDELERGADGRRNIDR